MAEKIPTALGVENSDLICELLAGLETKDVVNEDEVVLTLEPVKSQDTMEVGCKWLNDEDINKVMELIKKQFPLLEGLHNCLIGHSYRSFPKTDGAFIQILHINGNHWITVQHEPQSGFVHVYDSMYSSTSFDAKRQIAALLRMKDRQIELKIQPVQYQKGCTDCGVFAVAFATDLAHGCNPSEHQYNQDELRSHFHKCLREVKMTPFPSTQQTPGRPKTEYIEVFCTCRLPANNLMVQCSECKEKYHTSCISTSPSLHCKCSTNACNIENERVTMEGQSCMFCSWYYCITLLLSRIYRSGIQRFAAVRSASFDPLEKSVRQKNEKYTCIN